MNNEIYLDNAATSVIAPEVKKHLMNLYDLQLGNTSSIHRSGVLASVELEKARHVLAKKIGCKNIEVVFTSGATESNNFVFNAVSDRNPNSTKNEILISSIEHSSVSEPAENLRKSGYKIKEIPVNQQGLIDTDNFKNLISENTLLVSVVHANSEIGTIQNIKKIGEICRQNQIYFHSDGAQAFCKTDLNFKEMNLDFYSLSSHKIHGPKGIGAVVIREGLNLKKLLFGGAQENNFRAGTTAVELASAFAKATDLYTEHECLQMKNKQDFLIKQLKLIRPEIRINGSVNQRLINNINFSIPGIDGRHILKIMDQNNIRVSTGSACNSNKKTPSKVLLSIGQTETQANEGVRVSLGLQTLQSDLDKFLSVLSKIKDQ